MRLVRQQMSVRRWSSAILLCTSLIAGAAAANSQQALPGAAAGSSPQAMAADALPPITPENVGDALLVISGAKPFRRRVFSERLPSAN